MVDVVKSSKSKGDAFLHYVGFLRGPDRKSVIIGNRAVGLIHSGSNRLGITSGGRLHLLHAHLAVMFRRFGL